MSFFYKCVAQVKKELLKVWKILKIKNPNLLFNSLLGFYLVERKGFEPSIPSRVYTLSKRAPSATRPPL